MEDTKKIASMIVAAGPADGKPKAEKGEDPAEASINRDIENDSAGNPKDEGKMHASSEIMDALHSKDHKALKTALENFWSMCDED